MDGGPKAQTNINNVAPTGHGKNLEAVKPAAPVQVVQAAQPTTPVTPVTPVASATPQQTTAQNRVRTTQSEEDGVVLRWR